MTCKRHGDGAVKRRLHDSLYANSSKGLENSAQSGFKIYLKGEKYEIQIELQEKRKKKTSKMNPERKKEQIDVYKMNT
jgi:hypothetical protein